MFNKFAKFSQTLPDVNGKVFAITGKKSEGKVYFPIALQSNTTNRNNIKTKIV